MFDWENIPTDQWLQSVPAELKETIRDDRISFAEFLDELGAKLVRAGAVSFRRSNGQSLMNLAIIDIEEVKNGLPSSSLRRFKNLSQSEYPSAIAAAYFELLSGSATVKALAFFHRLLEIGKNHAETLSSDYSVWAEKQSLYLIYSQLRAFVLWVIDLCEQASEFSEEDSGAESMIQPQPIFGREWRAPRFLIMQPSPIGYEPFAAELAWTRSDFRGTQLILNSLARFFFQRVSQHIKQAAIKHRAEIAVPVVRPVGTTEDSRANRGTSATESVNPIKQVRRSGIRVRKRTQVIFGAIHAGYTEREYVSFLDREKLSLPQTWSKDAVFPNYSKAYNDPKLRERIHKERNKYKKKYDRTAEHDRELIIEGRFD